MLQRQQHLPVGRPHVEAIRPIGIETERGVRFAEVRVGRRAQLAVHRGVQGVALHDEVAVAIGPAARDAVGGGNHRVHAVGVALAFLKDVAGQRELDRGFPGPEQIVGHADAWRQVLPAQHLRARIVAGDRQPANRIDVNRVVRRPELVESQPTAERQTLHRELVLQEQPERLQEQRRRVRRRVVGHLVRHAVQRAVVHVANREDDRVLGELPRVGQAGFQAVRAGHVGERHAVVVDGLRRRKIRRVRPEPAGSSIARESTARSRRARAAGETS